jgi:hypothetical protein
MAQPAPQSARLEAVERDAQPRPPDQPDDALDRLTARYAFRRPEEVVAYLRRYPHLVPVLFEAAEVIPRYFGADAPLALEVFVDPEDELECRELFAIVQTALGSAEALDRLDRLDEDWWTMASPDGPGTLVVDIEHV